VVKIEGASDDSDNAVTRGFICGKVRRFTDRVYGEDRLLYPAVRQGGKGHGTFARVTWDEALELIARRMLELRASKGAEAILPFCYGGSNGLLTQDTNDATLFRGLGASRLARTVCAAPTGAANLGLSSSCGASIRQPQGSTSCPTCVTRRKPARASSSSIRDRHRWPARRICTSR
jgi:anaerobic selenocysteine-containing dehydrogenase